jgi:hypothetical protein
LKLFKLNQVKKSFGLIIRKKINMKKLLFLSLIVFVFGACTENISDYNADTKNPEVVPSSALIGNATVELFDFMAEPNVNVNNFRLYAQHWAQTTYPDESNYELVERNINGRAWNTLYATVLRDLQEAKPLIEADEFLSDSEKSVQMAIIGTMEVFTYSLLVELFGDIPYSEALDTENVTPVYDDAKTVYYDLISRLDAAINALNAPSGLGDEIIYGGDYAHWRKFANSLKLRMAVRIADYDEAKAKAMAEAAVADGVFESDADNFQITYYSGTPNTNPLWEQLIQSGRSDFVAAGTFAEALNLVSDPRIPFFFKNNGPNGEAVGGVYGTGNSFPANSQPGTKLEDPTWPGKIMSYTEVLFLLADAAERGFNVGGEGKDFYHAGITNSILEWGGSQEMVDAYLAHPLVNWDTNPGTWKQKIAAQKWAALYDMGYEAWTTYRMYDFPELPNAADTDRPVILRYAYPVTEYTLNGANLQAAVDKMGGDDNIWVKLFWDKF